MLHPDEFDKPSPGGNPPFVAPPPQPSSPAIQPQAPVFVSPPQIHGRHPVSGVSAPTPGTALRKLAAASAGLIVLAVLAWTTMSQLVHQSRGSATMAPPITAPTGTVSVANNASLDVLGLWTLTTEWDATYFGSTQRYHAKGTYSVLIERAENGFRARWHETRDERNLDDQGKLSLAYDAIFYLRADGDRLAGNSESARVRFGDNAWQELPSVAFAGGLLPTGQLQYEVNWQRDSSGKPNNTSNGTLQRPSPSATLAAVPEDGETADSNLGGSWTLQSDWEGRFTDNNQRYRATATYTAEIQSAGDGLQVVLHEMRDIYYIENLNRFTLECQGTFKLRRDGKQLSGQAESAALHFDNGAWQNLSPASFSGAVISPTQLQFEVIWQRGPDDKEITGARGVLQRH